MPSRSLQDLPAVLQYRGEAVEAAHPFSAVAIRHELTSAEVIWQVGSDVLTPWRSAAKPFQLATSLELLGDPAVTEFELAIGAASHSAEDSHVDLVRGLLARFDVGEWDLRCGTHPPMHQPTADAILRRGGHFSEVHNNCSGKHAFMLAATARQAWPLDYRPVDHPLQRRILLDIERWTEEQPRLAVDGCGLPTFCLPLSGIARAYGALAFATHRVLAGTATPTELRLGRIGKAMARHPEVTSGSERLDLSVVRHGLEPILGKIGAQGVFCLALPLRNLAIAIKVHSGVGEALGAVIAYALEQVAPGAWHRGERWRFLEVHNWAGDLVGDYRVLL
jgi:L-asparaginase II